jgi:hypothetical protein
MSKHKIRINNTELDNLVSNLRGEIGEIIFSWILMRNLKVQDRHLQTDKISYDLKNDDLKILYVLIDKLEDDIIGRLSELAEKKVGQLTFYFVQEKLCLFKREVDGFSKFIRSNRFHEKRNYDISHKQLPEKWSGHKCIHIPYRIIVKGIVLSLRLMKKIDIMVLGPSAPFLWREMRKRRYVTVSPAKVAYMLLPHLCLSAKDRVKIVFLEAIKNKNTWVDMKTTIDGSSVTVQACKKWGVVKWRTSIIVLQRYPIVEIKSIKTKNQNIK